MTVTRKDTPRGRFYDVDDQLYPSVTHILGAISKPALVAWAANQERTLCLEAATALYGELSKALKQPIPAAMFQTTLEQRIGKTKAHQKELAKAAEIGSQVHAAIEWTLRRQLGQTVGRWPALSPEATICVSAFKDWSDTVHLEPLALEQTVYSKRHGYAGTLDLLANVRGLKTVLDWKTGKSVYGEAHLQNAAYRMALEDMGHGPIGHGMIVRFPKVATDPGFEVVHVEEDQIQHLFAVFLAVMQVWQWQYQNDSAYWAQKEAKG